MDKTCPCGKIFFVKTYLLHRKKYCCKACFYKYHGRKSGLKYKLVKENPTAFKKGHKPWNDGLAGKGICKPTFGSIKKGERRGVQTEFTSENTAGSKNIKWKGESVGYGALHSWVYRVLGKAKKCEWCENSSGRIEWANKSRNYKREVEDWIQLCKKCHYKHDKDSWGSATKLWKLTKK